MAERPGTVAEAMDLPSPLPALGLEFTKDELGETAYEIFAAACKPSFGHGTLGRTKSGLTYIPQSSQRFLASSTASKMKKALGLRSKNGDTEHLLDPPSKIKKPQSIADVVRSQMGISEQSDSRIKRALSRTAAGQIGKNIELILLPVELLQQMRLADFADSREYQSWQRRQLKVLEAGLLLHPAVKLEQSNNAAQRLRQLILSSTQKLLETGKNSESMQALRSAATSLASRMDGEKTEDVCHWVDGFPFNLHVYQMLLNTVFDKTDGTVVIDEIDEMMEFIKKCWGILGIHQAFHNLCFLWTLFCQFVVTGQSEFDLLRATETQLEEVAKDAKELKSSQYTIVLSSVLSAIQSWGEKRFLAYHDTFPAGAKGTMECLLPVTLNAAKILSDDLSKEYKHKRKEVNIISSRVEFYVRSSLRTAFAQLMEQVDSKRRLLKGEKGVPPALVVLAKDTMGLIASEAEKFSPTLKRWHTFAAGLAATTIHSCIRKELDQFLQGVKVLTPEAMEVLQSVDELEKVLVQVAVEDAVDCEDGGKGLIREMAPFEAASIISSLSENWIKESLDRLKHWVDRNVRQEEWNPQAIREHYAPSIVEVFRMIEETLDAFYALPVADVSDLLQKLVAGIDRALQHYASQSKVGCGLKKDFLPSFPLLTRCREAKNNSNFGLLWKKKERGWISHRNKTQQQHIGGTWRERIESSSLPRICVRINTLYYIQTESDSLEVRISNGWKKDTALSHSSIKPSLAKSFLKTFSSLSERNGPKVVVGQNSIRFEHARNGAQEGIQQLCEAAGYKIVFHDLQTVFGNGLYSGGVTHRRINQIIEPLDIHLEIIANTVHERLRNRVISVLMKACFERFLMVLLAGGPSRFFTVDDAEMLDEDFAALKDLFKANGEGLPGEVVEKAAMPVNQVLPLFAIDTIDLIETFRSILLETYGARMNASKVLPLPDTTGQWKPTDANTLLRILCYRSDKTASKFLKKTYNLPKN